MTIDYGRLPAEQVVRAARTLDAYIALQTRYALNSLVHPGAADE